MREVVGQNSTTYWLLTDHLGSQSITANADGSFHSEVRYTAFGETRYTSANDTPTDYLYTGQRLEEEAGLYYYGARFYDAALAHFIQADTVVPYTTEQIIFEDNKSKEDESYSVLVVDYHEYQLLDLINRENKLHLENSSAKRNEIPTNPLAYERYTYVNNNPIRYNDPSGHCAACVVVASGAGFTISAPVIIIAVLVVVVGVVAYDTFAPEKNKDMRKSVPEYGLCLQKSRMLNLLIIYKRNLD